MFGVQVHELEIQKVEMRSEALMKEYELQRRELVIMRYDRQRSLCDQIITRQRQMLDGKTDGKLHEGSHCTTYWYLIAKAVPVHPSQNKL